MPSTYVLLIFMPSTDKGNNHRSALIHHKPTKVNLSQTSHIPQGVLTTNQIVASSNTSQVCSSQVFTQLAQLQVKPGNLSQLQKTGPGNKLTMQPVSITFPLPHLGTVPGQQQQATHALFISNSDDGQHGQRLDLQQQQQQQQVSSSPSNSLMS